MNTRLLGLALALAGSIAFVCPAWADVPPPDGYVETCTVANQQTATSECLVCYATRGIADRCEPLLSPFCFTKVCHAWSGSTEVWCRTSGPGVPSVPSAILDVLRPADFPLPSAIDGGTAADPGVCLPFAPVDAGASGLSSVDAHAKDSSGCAVGGWVSARTFGPWLMAGVLAAAVALRRRRRR